jgi:predicted 2-oxoglutarate/Fe(II)-dependent dioxygenase YbiX
MLTAIAQNLFTVTGILRPDECEQLIARGEGIGFEAATVATPSGPKMMTNVRNNDRVTFDDVELASFIWQRIKPYLPAQVDGWTASGLNERFRFYRYDASQRFNAHRDGVVERSPHEKSRLTFMIYLNEGSEGGETVFYTETRVDGLRQVAATVKPSAGMGLIFAHEWWHEGARVLSGRKYVLRTDVMYRDEKMPTVK